MDIFTMIMACSLYNDNAITNAMLQIGSGNRPLAVSSITPDGERTAKSDFANTAQAAQYAQEQIDQGNKVFLGLMQVPASWLYRYKRRTSLEDTFRSCKNMVMATDVLNYATRLCHKDRNYSPSCALSVYRTGDSKTGILYAKKVLDYAKQNRLKEKAPPVPHRETPIAPRQPNKLPAPGFHAPKKD